MRKIVLWVFLITVAIIAIMSKLEIPSTVKFFVGAFGFGTTFVLVIVLPLLATYREES